MWSGWVVFIEIVYHLPCVSINHKIQLRYYSAPCRNVRPYSTVIMGREKQTRLSYPCSVFSQHSLGNSSLIAKEIMIVIYCASCFCNFAVNAAEKIRDRSAKTFIACTRINQGDRKNNPWINDQVIGAGRLFLPNNLNWNACNEQPPMYYSMHLYV